MINKLKQISNILTPVEIKKFKILIILMFFCMIFETMGIGVLIPLINYLTDANLSLISNDKIKNVISFFNLEEGNEINAILIFIATVYIVKNLYMTLFAWIDTKFGYYVRTALGVRLFKQYLHKPYIFHVYNNSANLITNIVEETKVFGNIIIFLSALITETLIIFGLIIFLFILDPMVTSIVIIISLILGVLFYFILRKKMTIGGQKRVLLAKKSTMSLHQGLSATKDLIFLNVQKHFIKIYSDNIFKHAHIATTQSFLQRLPRFWLEISAIMIILFSIYYLSSKQHEISAISGTLGIFVIAALRIMPSIQKIMVSLQYFKFSEPTLNLLEKELLDCNKIKIENEDKINDFKFNNTIEYKNISYSYPKSNKSVLENINLKINKHDFIGIIGKTGVGKTTLIDLLAGLLEPDQGEIKVDDTNINKKYYLLKNDIGYVPQNIFLIDDTVKRNIAFGQEDEKINNSKISLSIDSAQLSKFVNDLEKGLDTIVGERGIKISGGEKQRIGIARALYNNPSILIFDEATSALDLNTEKNILETLLNLKKEKTIILITHRVSSLKYCNKIYQVKDSQLKKVNDINNIN